MPDPFRKVRPGEPIPTSASLWNKLIEMAEQRLDSRSAPRTTTRDASIIRVKNETGSPLARKSIVGLSAPIFPPSASVDAFLREVAFRGVEPGGEHAGRFAVLLEPAPPDRVVRAFAAGVCAARVNVTDESHTCADVEEGNTTALLSAEVGSAQILWREGLEEGYGYETGEQWALISIGTTCRATASLVVTVAGCFGLPAPGVEVVVKVDGDVVAGPETTDAGGEASFPDVPTGTVTIEASHPRWDDTASEVVSLGAGSNTATVEMTGPIATGYICVGCCPLPVKLPLLVEDGAYSAALAEDFVLVGSYGVCREIQVDECYLGGAQCGVECGFPCDVFDPGSPMFSIVKYHFNPSLCRASMVVACCETDSGTGIYKYCNADCDIEPAAGDCQTGQVAGTGTCDPFEWVFEMPANGPHPATTMVVKESP
jgi:hypothetical protein